MRQSSQTAGRGVAVHPGAAAVEQDWPAQMLTRGAFEPGQVGSHGQA
jgi:hypothetical protein